MNKKKSIRLISILFLIATLIYKYNGKFYTKESRVDSSYVSAFNKDLNVQTHHENLSRNDWMKEMEKKYKQINKKIYDVCQNRYKQDKVTFNNHKRLRKWEFYGGFMYENWMLDIDHKLAYCKKN